MTKVDATLIRVASSLLVDVRHPAAVYIASLARGSRRAQIGALRVVAAFFNATPATCSWVSLGYAELVMLRSSLAERYAPATANRYLAAVRGVMRAGVRLELVEPVAFQRAFDFKPVRGDREVVGRHIERDELGRLFFAASSGRHPKRDRALLASAYGGGLRRDELAKLEPTDFQREAFLVRGKGGKVRVVPLPPKTVQAVKEWIAVRAIAPAFKNDERLFGLGEDAIYRLCQRLAKDAAIEHFSPHDFRRTYAGDLLDRKVDLQTLQKLLGHASPTTTGGYSRRGMRARREAAALLDLPI